MTLPFDEDLADILEAYRLHGIASGHSARTIDSRERTIARLGAQTNILDASRDDLVAWLAERDIGKASRSTYRAHLRGFFGWLHETGRRADNPAWSLPAVRVPRGVPHPITPDEVVLILAACSDPRARSTIPYILLAAYEGMRVHEIAKARGEDFSHGQVAITGKGGQSSTVPLHPLVAAIVEHMPRTGWWFPSPTGPDGHVSRISVSLAIKRAMTRAGVAGTPHGLRHHFGTQVLRASGGDLRTAQRALRHASPATTAIYTQVADDALFRAVSGIPAA